MCIRDRKSVFQEICRWSALSRLRNFVPVAGKLLKQKMLTSNLLSLKMKRPLWCSLAGMWIDVYKRQKILFGLEAIRGVGEKVVTQILEERKANGLFTGLNDFITVSYTHLDVYKRQVHCHVDVKFHCKLDFWLYLHTYAP